MKWTWITSLVLLCGLALAISSPATDLKVTLEVEGRTFLVGAPIALHATIENVSGRTLYLAYGEKGFSTFPAVEPTDRGVHSFCPPQDVKKVEWREGYEIKPLGPGECLKYTGALCDFTRDFARPGVYKIAWKAQSPGPYEKRVGGQVLEAYPQAWSGVADSNIVEIEVLDPTGIDREALEKIIRPAVQDLRTLPGLGLWAEKVLKEYPASTYAGYALRQRIPSLAQWALTCLNNPDETLQTWGNRGGGEENTRGHIAEAQGDMRAYAKNAEAFLKAHAGFVYAAEIRRAYAMCLGLTGHITDAMAEVQTLTTGTGKEAEEAKSFLAKRASTKPGA